MHIVFYGPEGSGKGTQAKLLSEKLNLPVLVSGDLVREAAATDKGMIGDICRKALLEGKYVADSEMFVLWKNRLKRRDAKKGWIMDGFPRNVTQAEFLDDKLDKYGYKVEHVIFLKISPEESMKRLIARKREAFAGSHVSHDDPEKIKERLKRYRQGESDVLKFYKSKGVLIEINGQQNVENVHKDIVSAICK